MNDGGAARRTEKLRLAALLDGKRVGDVFQNQTGRLRFVYADDWRERADSYPISLSMPLSGREHENDVVTAFLWGLLPDNSQTLARYGRLYGVFAGNPVALLEHIGADCAGAIQFAPPERVESLLSEARAPLNVQWLDEAEVGKELRTVREQGIPGTNPRTAGQFSLAGAQPKIALLEKNGRWGRPSGRTPTTKILKPPSNDFEGFAENEHFCLTLARHLGLAAVQSTVMTFAGEVAIVVDRFDRRLVGSTYPRIHQEDTCQALGIMPTRKYENEGGPGIRDITELLRDSSEQPTEDVDRFLKATALNWVIAATDAHAKNYALLHGPGSSTRLAPLYDITSYLPYTDLTLHGVKVAMEVDGEYLVRRIGRGHWKALAKSLRVPGKSTLELVESVVENALTSIDAVEEEVVSSGLTAPVVYRLASRIRERAADCLKQLNPSQSNRPADT